MALFRFPPVVSTAASVFARDDRAAAVQAALLGLPNGSSEYPNLPLIWPQIRSYENDPVELAIPFVWGPVNFTPGLRLGFATIVNPALPIGNYGYTLGAFADNAHRMYLELYTVSGTTITLVQTIASNLIAGSLDPNVVESQLAVYTLLVRFVYDDGYGIFGLIV